MTQSEKRYFKLHASRLYKKEELPLIKLFDLIAKQPHYNEMLIKSSFGSDFFAQKKKLLHDKVLDSLKSFHRGANVHSQLDELLAEFRILLNKSVFKQAIKTLKKARRLAEKHELFTELIRINHAETEYYVATANTSTLERHIANMRVEVPQLVQLLDSKQIIENAYVHFVKENSEREFVRSEQELIILRKSADQLIRLDTDKIHSFQAKVKAYYTKGVYYYLSGDFIESLKWFEKQIEAFEQNPQFNIEFQFEKARALANCALISLRINTETSFNRCFTGLNDFNAKTRRLSNQINYWCYVLKFSQIVKNGGYKEALDFSETAPLVNTLEVKFEAENVLVTERYLMLLGKIQAHMMLGENKNALRLINSFLNSPSAETKQDAYIFIRFLFLFIHQELGNTEIVENGIRSLERYLKLKGRVFQFEQKTLEVLSELSRTNDKKAASIVWKDYKLVILGFKKDSFERNAIINFDIEKWLEYKLLLTS